MTLNELKQLCKQGEGQYLEFKQFASEPDQIVEEISGFLNSKGGQLLIGVKDDHTISGLKFPEDDLSFILDYIRNKIKPKFTVEHEIIPVSSKKAVIILRVPEGPLKPYTVLNTDPRANRVYYRIADECVRASRELKAILRYKKLKKGLTIQYSEIEAAVLKMVENKERTTKGELVENLPFSSRTISDCLVRLVSWKVLKIIPSTGGDLYDHHQIS